MKDLTKAEEQIMQILWKLKKAFIREIIKEMPDPKPAYTTTATLVKILENKGFVNHIEYGKMFQYFPLIEKEEFANQRVTNVVKDYFENSFSNLVSFFAKKENISEKEKAQIQKILNELKEK